MLDGGVDLPLPHGHAGATHATQHLDHGVGLHDADLLTFHVFGRLDGGTLDVHAAGAGGIGGQHLEAVALGGAEQGVQGIAGKDSALVLRVVIDVGHGEDGEVLVEVLDQGVGDHRQLDGAGLHQLQRGTLITQQLVRVDLQLVLAAGGGFQFLAEVFERLELGVVFGLVERRLQDHGTSSLAVFTTSRQQQTRGDHCANQRQLGQSIHCTHV